MEQADNTVVGPRVFIYGSCVSRDAFQLDHAPTLAAYVARSAMGSAFAERPTETPHGIDLQRNPSPFQRRMVALDLEKGLARLLRTADYDVLLLDLIDERLRMLRSGGSVVTDSNEARRCGLVSTPRDRVRVGSDEYLSLFAAGFRRFLDVLPADRIVLNRVFWATHTSDGDRLPDQDSIRDHNDALRAAYEITDAAGIRSIEYDPDLFVADPEHKWGASPFHYGSRLYEHTLTALAQAPLGSGRSA